MKVDVLFRASVLLVISLLVSCGGGGGGGGGGSSTPPFEAINEPGGLPVGYGPDPVWADEFDYVGLPDPTKWAYDTHANSFGWYNNELQYYSNARTENSRVDGDVLIIEARREAADALPSNNGQDYTSARLVTQGQASWTYAFIEVRAKVPCGQGSWPAIWTLADVPGMQWPLDGEMDIMEHVNNEALIHFNVHTDAHNHAEGTAAGTSRSVTVCDDSFHNYQLTWTPTEILIGMDNNNYLRYNNVGNGVSQWPFDQPQFLLLNIAVGGDWPGTPNDSIFPITMEVDYVRVYQIPD
jgi:beta-glucanase (GH16 family)